MLKGSDPDFVLKEMYATGRDKIARSALYTTLTLAPARLAASHFATFPRRGELSYGQPPQGRAA